MRERQEVYKKEKFESKLRRQTLSTALQDPQSPIESWANDVLERRDTHYEYTPVLRMGISPVPSSWTHCAVYSPQENCKHS